MEKRNKCCKGTRSGGKGGWEANSIIIKMEERRKKILNFRSRNIEAATKYLMAHGGLSGEFLLLVKWIFR